MGSYGLLDRMDANPGANWTIKDVETSAAQHNVDCDPPRGGGSHYKVRHPSQQDIVTVPMNRPIKAIYIRKVVEFIRRVGSQLGAPNGRIGLPDRD